MPVSSCTCPSRLGEMSVRDSSTKIPSSGIPAATPLRSHDATLSLGKSCDETFIVRENPGIAASLPPSSLARPVVATTPPPKQFNPADFGFGLRVDVDSTELRTALDCSDGSIPPLRNVRPQSGSTPPIVELSQSLRLSSDEPVSDFSWQFLTVAPAWLFSMTIHLCAMLLLGLLFLGLERTDNLQLEMVFAESLGEQLIDDTFDLPIGNDIAEETVVTPDLPDLVEKPIASLVDIDVFDAGHLATNELVTPTIGIALEGREEGMKQSLLATYGGTAMTEGAVALGLKWLEKNQRSGGFWSLRGPYQNGAPMENRVAATAMAMLAFQGAGHTHKRGSYKKVVQRGMEYLIKEMDSDGSFYHDIGNQRLYTQAQATIAICELYGMTKDESLRGIAQMAIDYAVKIQDSLGGWRYDPGSDTDTSVTGWFVMAFQSAQMAGLNVPDEVYNGVSKYLDIVASYDGSRYAYRPGREFSEAMTAEALLCRQYLGWSREDGRLRDGVNYLRLQPINYRDQNVYYWYYATQVMHHMEGDEWTEWNVIMRESVPENQTKTGKDAGSWSPVNDRWGGHAGRLYTTCLSIYMLEVYYRHLPIYGLAH